MLHVLHMHSYQQVSLQTCCEDCLEYVLPQCRLCPKKTTSAEVSSAKQMQQLLPYEREVDFTAALDAWRDKYKTVQSNRDETPEETVMRLSEKLCNDKELLQARVLALLIPSQNPCQPALTLAITLYAHQTLSQVVPLNPV